jgi:hypothetical protein
MSVMSHSSKLTALAMAAALVQTAAAVRGVAHGARGSTSRVRMAAVDVPAIIVGGGRIGNALAGMGVAGDVVLKRGEPFPSEPSTGPIYICTRNGEGQGRVRVGLG